jgi:hypothetical protein
LNILFKLGKQGLEWRLEPETFAGREVCGEATARPSFASCAQQGMQIGDRIPRRGRLRAGSLRLGLFPDRGSGAVVRARPSDLGHLAEDGQLRLIG